MRSVGRESSATQASGKWCLPPSDGPIRAGIATDTGPALIHLRVADEQNVFPFMPAVAGLSDLLEE